MIPSSLSADQQQTTTTTTTSSTAAATATQAKASSPRLLVNCSRAQFRILTDSVYSADWVVVTNRSHGVRPGHLVFSVSVDGTPGFFGDDVRFQGSAEISDKKRDFLQSIRSTFVPLEYVPCPLFPGQLSPHLIVPNTTAEVDEDTPIPLEVTALGRSGSTWHAEVVKICLLPINSNHSDLRDPQKYKMVAKGYGNLGMIAKKLERMDESPPLEKKRRKKSVVLGKRIPPRMVGRHNSLSRSLAGSTDSEEEISEDEDDDGEGSWRPERKRPAYHPTEWKSERGLGVKGEKYSLERHTPKHESGSLLLPEEGEMSLRVEPSGVHFCMSRVKGTLEEVNMTLKLLYQLEKQRRIATQPPPAI